MKLLKGACIEPMYAEIPFLDRFQAAKDDGFDYVEFWSWTDKDLAAVKAAAAAAGVGISGFNGDAELSLILAALTPHMSPAEKKRMQLIQSMMKAALTKQKRPE